MGAAHVQVNLGPLSGGEPFPVETESAVRVSEDELAGSGENPRPGVARQVRSRRDRGRGDAVEDRRRVGDLRGPVEDVFERGVRRSQAALRPVARELRPEQERQRRRDRERAQDPQRAFGSSGRSEAIRQLRPAARSSGAAEIGR